jgi:hypothetical protein
MYTEQDDTRRADTTEPNLPVPHRPVVVPQPEDEDAWEQVTTLKLFRIYKLQVPMRALSDRGAHTGTPNGLVTDKIRFILPYVEGHRHTQSLIFGTNEGRGGEYYEREQKRTCVGFAFEDDDVYQNKFPTCPYFFRGLCWERGGTSLYRARITMYLSRTYYGGTMYL